MSTVFRFGDYTLRQTTAADRYLLESFIAVDPFHAGKVDPEFFMETVPGEDVWALEDAQGRVVFYLKTQTACRVHIQFGPAIAAADRQRNRDALREGLDWLETRLAANSFRELIFDSANPLLRATAQRRWGFCPAPDDLRSTLPMPGTPKTPCETVARVATSEEKGDV